MSTREAILAAIQAALSSLASGRVYRSRLEQLPAVPAIVITPESEESEEVVMGLSDATLEVTVSAYVRGDTPDNAGDALISSIHAALMADLSLGLGSDVQIVPARSVKWDFDQYDEARIAIRYRIKFRTSIGGM